MTSETQPEPQPLMDMLDLDTCARELILLVEDNPKDLERTLEAFAEAQRTNDIVVARDGAEMFTHLFPDGNPPPSTLNEPWPGCHPRWSRGA